MGLLYCVERRKYQTTSAVTFSGAGNFSKISRTVKKLPSDFDIFSLSTVTKPLCIQYRANSLPVAAQDWAISFSWCGKMRSWPPPWMSNVSPRCFIAMAEHSMCQPGRPGNERSEEHTSELQSRLHLVCRLLLEKKKKKYRSS